MQSAFHYRTRDARVVFGEDALETLGSVMDDLGRSRALIVATPELAATANRVATHLGDRQAGVFDEARQHVPVGTVQAAREALQRTEADCCITVGGGSSTGLGKALSLEVDDLPILAVPTTYAGSEMTSIWGLTDAGAKRTGRAARVAPRAVFYVPSFTTGLPPSISGPSGMNALAHSVEALYAVDCDPVTSLFAEESIRALAASLPRVVAEPEDLDARTEALYGAHLAGRVLDGASMALHHKLCHVLGGTFNLPHGPTHAVVLPYATAYNAPEVPEAMRRVARALGAEDAAKGLYALNRALDIPPSLEALGLKARDLDAAADAAIANQYPNPRPITRAGIRHLLDDAYHGRRPQSHAHLTASTTPDA